MMHVYNLYQSLVEEMRVMKHISEKKNCEAGCRKREDLSNKKTRWRVLKSGAVTMIGFVAIHS